ncbi:MAG: PEGA domain-containing protein [Candidatus Aminicenantes bacterium]|nr:PEGA domain-containing protein [Candidatus Aminicenantes bacterium]
MLAAVKIKSISFFLILFLLIPAFMWALTLEEPASHDEKFNPVVRTRVSGQESSSRQQDYEMYMNAGKQLYMEQMNYEMAALRFQKALTLAGTQAQKADVYFYLSLCHYAMIQTKGAADFENAVRELIVYDYYRELDKSICPRRYLEFFQEIKKEYGVLRINSNPSGAEVFIDEKNQAAGQTPLVVGYREGTATFRLKKEKAEKKETLRVRAGQETQSPIYKLKKRSSLLYIIGGAVLAGGGTAAVLLLSGGEAEETIPAGTIHVYSTPKGASVYLDGSATGKTTDCTLTDVSPGSHTVKLAKEGYVEEEETVLVTEGGAATVNLTLTQHTLNITDPKSDTIWTTGEPADITWETGETAILENSNLDESALLKENSFSPFRSTFSGFPGSRMNPFGIKYGPKNIPQENRCFIPRTTDGFTSGRKNVKYNRRIFSSLSQKRALSAVVPGLSPSPNKKSAEDLFRNPYARFLQRDQKNSENIKPLTLSNVKIELFQAANFVQTIVESAENSGLYSWTVPTSLEDGTGFKVKISCADDPGIFDESASFRITLGYEFVKKWGGTGIGNGQFQEPHGIVVAGYVYVVDYRNSRVQKFTTDGTYISKWGSYGDGDNNFYYPTGIAVDSAGNVYVADNVNDCIKKFTANGTFITKWGEYGTEDGQFKQPYGVAVDGSNNIYVCDWLNHRIQKFTSNGTFITKWGGEGTANGKFSWPSGIAVSDAVYVADEANNRIQKFTKNGTFISKWGTPGTWDGQFQRPGWVAIDDEGNVFVSDGSNHRIQKFTSDGTFLTKWGQSGEEAGEFVYPMGVAVDESGNVYVVDIGDYVHKFRPNKGTAGSKVLRQNRKN